jgi:hypothetical protein
MTRYSEGMAMVDWSMCRNVSTDDSVKIDRGPFVPNVVVLLLLLVVVLLLLVVVAVLVVPCL